MNDSNNNTRDIQGIRPIVETLLVTTGAITHEGSAWRASFDTPLTGFNADMTYPSQNALVDAVSLAVAQQSANRRVA